MWCDVGQKANKQAVYPVINIFVFNAIDYQKIVFIH